MLFIFTCVLGALVNTATTASIPGVVTTEQFNHSAILDNDQKYLLFWNYNASHVTFEVHVQTTGFVGFGISDNGKMFPGDVVIGWVDNQTTHFADYHTTGHIAPVLDQSQDWILLHGEENQVRTVLKFARRIDTCDTEGDIVIQEDTVRLIYSYNDKDPENDTALFYHGALTRGTKSESLLSEFEVPENLPDDIRHIEFLQRNFIIPNASTTYWCMGFQIPDLGGKHHMIQYEPVITPGNELNVHHALIYSCKHINSSYDGVQGNCYEQDRPLPQCYDVIIAWAIGGEPFYFPSNAGFSIGDSDDSRFYIMEMHFDNPKQESGKIDSSGIRISITKNLRTHDAGMLQIGHEVNYHQIIPPHQKDFLSKSYCSEQCISKGLNGANVTEIRVFAALQHAHLLGVGMKTRHFRNGTELAPLMYDPDYDFDFQELRMMPKERIVKPGDSFSVECTYDSSGRTKPTFGGLSTQDEMCLTFAYYYPRIGVSSCLSQPTLDTFTEHGYQLYYMLMNLNWDAPHVVADLIKKVQNSAVRHECIGADTSYSVVDFIEQETSHPYQTPPSHCSMPATG